ncbi:Crinkler (CRN) family protein [Caenorhabditis elegans]|uniref:Crinkler (CRN) family protein n=1 Tax=Caenorhabditis elegans TaxID=6239 RepID=Q93556_CAEEL|nr:Crinkler (CRN) family protein [Caenorhabditis elegans]CAB02977.1 Crinkler (CRN) family protein [Caenorhabditis elegans]|eukprot:NP_510643.1 Uncharacterized protein CELE_F23A7.3 [Caenorhabditis elegans]
MVRIICKRKTAEDKPNAFEFKKVNKGLTSPSDGPFVIAHFPKNMIWEIDQETSNEKYIAYFPTIVSSPDTKRLMENDQLKMLYEKLRDHKSGPLKTQIDGTNFVAVEQDAEPHQIESIQLLPNGNLKLYWPVICRDELEEDTNKEFNEMKKDLYETKRELTEVRISLMNLEAEHRTLQTNCNRKDTQLFERHEEIQQLKDHIQWKSKDTEVAAKMVFQMQNKHKEEVEKYTSTISKLKEEVVAKDKEIVENKTANDNMVSALLGLINKQRRVGT